MNSKKLLQLFLMKLKYASTALVGTIVNWVVFFWLVKQLDMQVLFAEPIAYSCGVLINFVLQKTFVFQLERKLSTTFILSMLIAVGGVLFSTLLMFLLSKIPFLLAHTILLKLLVTGVGFFYNFYLKRYAFEKRFL
ncbi:MAG: GtrA family protein [Bacteroidota bacterium]